MIRRYPPIAPIVTALPAIARDGQIIQYQNAVMATRGVVWVFRYNAASSSAYKWEFIAGAPLLSFVYPDGSPSTKPTVTGWTDSLSPSITVPLGGEYITDAEVAAASNASSGPSTVLMGVMRSGVDTGGPPIYNGMSNLAVGTALSIRSRCYWTAIDLGITLAPGGVLTQMQYNFPYIAASWSFKGISLLPIRVG